MFVNGRGVAADRWRVVRVLSAFGDRDAFNEWHVFIEQSRVTRGAQVVRAGMRQPQQIIREMCAHARTAGGMPPMLHVALRVLP